MRKLIEGLQIGGPYLPQGYKRLRVQFPGNHGGVNWGGTSFDPQLGYLFVNTNELGQLAGVTDRDPGATGSAQAAGQGNRVDPNGPYQGIPGGGRFKDEASNMMCQQPPWGQLTAVDVNTGEFAWRVPLGITESLPPEKQKTGRPGNGGPIATAEGWSSSPRPTMPGSVRSTRRPARSCGRSSSAAPRMRRPARISAKTASSTSSSPRPAVASSVRR